MLLAELLAEDQRPPASLWQESLVSSRLIEYETWTRIHSLGVTKSHAESARALLSRLAFLELSPIVLGRALEPFPKPVRTLDAIHLASVDYLRSQRIKIRLATYDTRMIVAGKALDIELEPL